MRAGSDTNYDALHCVKFSETTAAAQQVHDRHGLAVFEVPFPAARNAAPGQERTTWNSMRLRAKAHAISGTQQPQQFASHSPVSVLGESL